MNDKNVIFSSTLVNHANNGASLPEPETVTHSSSACDCMPECGVIVLWEENLCGDNGDRESFAVLRLEYIADVRHTERGHRPPRLAVTYIDLAKPQEQRRWGSGKYDITDTRLGRWIIDAWMKLDPRGYDALPLTHQEWLEMERKSLGTITQTLTENGIDTTGMTQDAIYERWNLFFDESQVRLRTAFDQM